MGDEERECGGTDWCHLSQDLAHCRDTVNKAMNRWVPQNAGNFLIGWSKICLSSETLRGSHSGTAEDSSLLGMLRRVNW
jgi:hypothetical protein